MMQQKPIVFISYAHEDIEIVKKFHKELTQTGITVWFDKESLRPGEHWRPAIKKAIRSCRFFIALLSSNSVGKRGYVQNELREALDVLDELPESDIFLLPIRINECQPSHQKLYDIQWVDLFPSWEVGMKKILNAISENSSPSSEPCLLTFITNEIENQRFLFSSKPWLFTTDPKGEDISSKHTARSKRMGLTPFTAFNSFYPTIAADEMTISFHLKNAGYIEVYLERLCLEVINKFPVSKSMFWNSWMPILIPHQYQIFLNSKQSFYDIDFEGNLIEIPPRRLEHFRLEIFGDASCTNHIFEFKLISTFHDMDGKKLDIYSDRIYHIAFSPESRIL